MDIREAFQLLLETPELVEAAGLSEVNRRALKMKLTNNDITLRYDTMRGWLIKAGFTEKTQWSKPAKRKTPNVETSGDNQIKCTN